MKIALAALVLCPALLAVGCKQKPPPPPPANPIIGEWACTTPTDKAKAKIGAVFTADGKSTVDITLTANAGGKRVAGKLSTTGKWSQKGQTFTLTLGDFAVAYATTNGEKSSDGTVNSLARSLLQGKDLAIETLNETEFAYTTKAGTVTCTRQDAAP